MENQQDVNGLVETLEGRITSDGAGVLALHGPTQWIPVASLTSGDSPRLGGENLEHIRMLARMDVKLPPIIVHRPSMRVIDGAHRLGATRLRGDASIEVRFFEGSEQEAFVLAVQANIAHGLPLSLSDRTTAAERILTSHPNWSDRAIAQATGLGARTVAGIRRRLDTPEGQTPEGGGFRVGRDGRLRPVNSAEGRLKAQQYISGKPGASLREISRIAGVSPSTARDVRNRMRRGEDVLPTPRLDTQRRGASELAAQAAPGRAKPLLNSVLQSLTKDPSLRFSESGRGLLRWIFARCIQPEEWREVADKVPPHTTYIVADLARRCADEWLQLADSLEDRARETA